MLLIAATIWGHNMKTMEPKSVSLRTLEFSKKQKLEVWEGLAPYKLGLSMPLLNLFDD